MGAIRLFLALVVALDHFRMVVLAPAKLDLSARYELGVNGGYAVMFFYMISGFLISMVLSRKYPYGAAGTFAFYQSRFIRIFSLYWPVALIAFVTLAPAGNATVVSAGDIFTRVFVLGIDWRVAFASYPDLHWAAGILGLFQAWTLGPELTFYLLAPWLLRSWRWTTGLLVLSAATRAVAVSHFGFDVVWTYMFLPSTLVFFLLGHLAWSASGRVGLLRNGYVGCGLLAASVACLMLGSYATWDSVRFWGAVACLGAALPGVFHATARWRVLNYLGALSYPLYLTHAFLMMQLHGVFQRALQLDAFHGAHAAELLSLAFLSTCVLVAALAHALMEVPVAAAMRHVANPLRLRMERALARG